MINGSYEMREAAKEVARYARLLYTRHLVHAAGGNVSVRLGPGDGFLITPSGVSLRNVSRSGLVQVDFEGNVIGEDGRCERGPEGWFPPAPGGPIPSKEYRMHAAVYMNRPDVNAVVHVHSPYATGFAIRGGGLPMMTASARLKLVRVPLVKYADPGSSLLADHVTDALRSPDSKEAKALLLASHGVLAFDDTLSHAFEVAELVEETAHVAFVALMLGSLGE